MLTETSTPVATPSQKSALREAAADLAPGFTLEDLIESAWRRWPKLFGMKTKPHPDTNKVLASVYHHRNGLKALGYLVPLGDGRWEYNPRPEPTSKILAACLTQPALHCERGLITFREACSLWECAGKSGTLAEKVARFNVAIREVAEGDDKQASRARRVFNVSVYLAGKFARQLAA